MSKMKPGQQFKITTRMEPSLLGRSSLEITNEGCFLSGFFDFWNPKEGCDTLAVKLRRTVKGVFLDLPVGWVSAEWSIEDYWEEQ